jgi:hypothetical protein
MKKKNLLSVLALAATSPALGMPQAFLASADDVIAIVYSHDVVEKLGDENEIQAIVRKEGNQFEVSAGTCKLQVTVIRYNDPNEPTPMIPKRRVELGDLTCANKAQ